MRQLSRRGIWGILALGAVLSIVASEFGFRIHEARAAGTVESTWLSMVEGQAANTALTQEVLFTTTSSCVTSLTLRKSIELYNNGPNTIFCSLTTAAVLNKGRPIAAAASWAIDLPPSIPLCCITSAPQLTTAATIATQTR